MRYCGWFRGPAVAPEQAQRCAASPVEVYLRVMRRERLSPMNPIETQVDQDAGYVMTIMHVLQRNQPEIIRDWLTCFEDESVGRGALIMRVIYCAIMGDQGIVAEPNNALDPGMRLIESLSEVAHHVKAAMTSLQRMQPTRVNDWFNGFQNNKEKMPLEHYLVMKMMCCAMLGDHSIVSNEKDPDDPGKVLLDVFSNRDLGDQWREELQESLGEALLSMYREHVQVLQKSQQPSHLADPLTTPRPAW